MKHFSRHLVAVCLAFSLCLSCVSPPKQAKAFVDPVTVLSVASLVVTSYFFVTGLIARLQDPGSSQDFSEAVVQLIKDTAGDEGIWGRDPETSEPWLYDSLLNHIQRNTTVGGSGLLVTTNWLAGCLSRLGTYLVDDLGVNKDAPVEVAQTGGSGYGNVSTTGFFDSVCFDSHYGSSLPLFDGVSATSSFVFTPFNFASLPVIRVSDDFDEFGIAAVPNYTQTFFDTGYSFCFFAFQTETGFKHILINCYNPDGSVIGSSRSSVSSFDSYTGFQIPAFRDGGDLRPYVFALLSTSNQVWSVRIARGNLFPRISQLLNNPDSVLDTPVASTGSVLTMQEEEYAPVGALLNTQGVAIQTPSDSDDIDDIYAAVIGGAAAGVLEPSDFAAEKADTPVVDVPDDLSLWDYLKAVWQSILDIPANLAEMLKRLCIPSEEYLAEFPSMILDRFGAQTGILTYPLAKTMEIISHLTAASISDPVFSWDAIREPFTGEVCFPAGSYNFSSMTENSVMSAALTTAKVLQGGGVIFLFMKYLHRKWCYLFGDDLDET